MSGETDFENRKVLVTGGSRGIGRAVCLELARRRALALKTDLAHASGVGAAIDRAAAEFGRLDVLVQAAGAMGAWHETAELSTDDWDRYLAVDLSGAFYVIRAARSE